MSEKEINNALNLISDSKTIAIMPSKVAGADSYCAAVGLYYMLLEKNKDVYFVHPGKIPEGCEALLEKDRIASNVTQREVMISIDYSGTEAGQAHYSTANDVLTIKLGPVPKDFNIERIRAKITGFDFDLIIVIGAQEIDDLGTTYKNLKTEFMGAKVINIDNTKRNQGFGDVNIVDSNAYSLGSLVFALGSKWSLTPTEKAAKAVLIGMTYRNANLGVDNTQ